LRKGIAGAIGIVTFALEVFDGFDAVAHDVVVGNGKFCESTLVDEQISGIVFRQQNVPPRSHLMQCRPQETINNGRKAYIYKIHLPKRNTGFPCRLVTDD